MGLMVRYLNENTTSLNFEIMKVMFLKGHMEKPDSRELFSLSLKLFEDGKKSRITEQGSIIFLIFFLKTIIFSLKQLFHCYVP